ncbi:uncharacterized protein [Medicago truncatula]|uniref:uncharacterized protein n=1 Tax=Medicago truncatula TaxID=3880 RepID=UPI000D2F3EA6|nr:uncharacterized protein LOC25483810 [Medicago truncatula]
MASSTENSDETFPSADIAAELNPGNNTEVQVDPISSEVAASKEIKEATDKQKKKQIEKKEYLDKLKSAIIISSIVVALAGAAFAITKKLKEK